VSVSHHQGVALSCHQQGVVQHSSQQQGVLGSQHPLATVVKQGSSKVVSKAMDDARNVPKAKDDAGNVTKFEDDAKDVLEAKPDAEHVPKDEAKDVCNAKDDAEDDSKVGDESGKSEKMSLRAPRKKWNKYKD